jgi:hypothetical protein
MSIPNAETDDPADILRDTPWFSHRLFPVVDVTEAPALEIEAIDYRSSIS